MKKRIFFKLLAAFVVVIAVATIILDITIRSAWEQSLSSEIEKSMIEKTRMFAHRVGSDHATPIQRLVDEAAKAGDVRATVIETSGKVLADSEAKASEMENHATRPEFIVALRGGTGSSRRWSHTVRVDFLYVAVPIPGGAVRLAYPLSAIQQTTKTVRETLLRSSLLALLVAIVLSGFAAESVARRLRRIVAFAGRVAAGDLSARITDYGSDEISQVASALDATARKLQQSFDQVESSRAELETLLNSMQDAVIAVSSEKKVQWANGLLYRYVAGAVRLGAPVVETVRDPEFLRAVEEALQTRTVRTVRSSSLVPGKTFHVTAAPMLGGGVVAVLHDLTEVERVEKTRRDFIANVSHELRTPLTSIQGYAETMLDPATDAGHARQFLEIIHKNAARMTRLTEDLLTLARVESGEKEFAFAAVPASQLLRDALQNFREIARSRGVELAIEEGTDRCVSADVDAIHQVLANLVDNALKYGGSGGSVLLGAREAGNSVEFYVRDLGAGIASEHLPRLFERFYRVDKARSRESGGTGLGLAIAKHIILAHGGAIRAESRLGHGSTFLFTLPAAQAAVA
ncbi:MAG: HAMP domain-containing protein [Acidobacteriia bacterium]|nr:HAMP domain-containing protein [Terriglobia bacterium]